MANQSLDKIAETGHNLRRFDSGGIIFGTCIFATGLAICSMKEYGSIVNQIVGGATALVGWGTVLYDLFSYKRR